MLQSNFFFPGAESSEGPKKADDARLGRVCPTPTERRGRRPRTRQGNAVISNRVVREVHYSLGRERRESFVIYSTSRSRNLIRCSPEARVLDPVSGHCPRPIESKADGGGGHEIRCRTGRDFSVSTESGRDGRRQAGNKELRTSWAPNINSSLDDVDHCWNRRVSLESHCVVCCLEAGAIWPAERRLRDGTFRGMKSFMVTVQGTRRRLHPAREGARVECRRTTAATVGASFNRKTEDSSSHRRAGPLSTS